MKLNNKEMLAAEKRLMDEIQAEKKLSFRKLVKILELNALMSARAY